MPPGLAGLGVRLCRVDDRRPLRRAVARPGRTEVGYLRLALPAAFAGRVPAAALSRRGRLRAGRGLRGAARASTSAAARSGRCATTSQWRTPGAAAEAVPPARAAGGALLQRRGAADRRAGFATEGVLERCLDSGGSTRGDDPARPEPPQRDAAGRLGRALAELELAVHLGVAALRGDGGREHRAFHRAAEALEARQRASSRCVSGGPTGRSWRSISPEQPVGPDGTSPHENPAFLRRMLVKHLLSLGKTCAYLDRFPRRPDGRSR